MKPEKQNTYSKFYRSSAILWVFLLVLYFILNGLVNYIGTENQFVNFISLVLHPIALFGLFGIPIIIIFSIPIRIVEYFIDK